MELKESGIKWLGKIPKHWEIGRVKYFYSFINGFTPNTSIASYYDNTNGFDWITIGDIKQKYVEKSKIQISQEYIDKFQPKITPKGSLLYSFKLSVGLVAFAKKDIYTNEAIASFLQKDNINLNFLYYSSFLIFFNAKENIYGAKLLNKELISSAIVVFPPLEEQKAIADFLDKKTQQIEELITKKQRLITLLEEKKQTLINQCVTQGLDTNAKLKESGIKWLGQIPTHWEVKKLKYIAKVVLGKMLCNEKQEGYSHCYYLKSKNLQWLNVDVSQVEKMWFSEYEKTIYRIKKDDLLVSEGGEVGKTCIWNDEIEECYIQNSVHKITMNSLNHSRFFLYVFFVYGKKGVFESIVNRVSIAHLVLEKLINIDFAVPPLEEQKAIADFLDEKCGKIDLLIEKTKKQIKLIKEYKTTLITEAVCGRIKIK